MVRNSEINFYVDCLVVDAVLSDQAMIKHAQGSAISGLIEKVKNYFASHVRSDDKLGSFVDLLGPAAAFMTFKSLGMPWIGTLAGLAMSVFHINISDIFRSIGSALSSILGGGGQTTSSTVDNIVNSAVNSAASSTAISTIPTSSSSGSDDVVSGLLSSVTKTSSTNFSLPHQRLREAKIIKLNMIHYHNNLYYKKANALSGIASAMSGSFFSVLKTILGWFFKVGLASLGFMVAGDVVNKLLGRGNALDGTMTGGVAKDTSADVEPAQSIKSSTQKVFPVNPSYRDTIESSGWSLSLPVNRPTIESMLVNFAKQVYQGLDNDNLIVSSPSFKAVADLILYYNRQNMDTNLLFIPTLFKSKKQIVDQFIDEVAEASKKSA